DLGADGCLGQIRRMKQAVGIPVIGWLTGVTAGCWIRYAKLSQEAGADGLEINIYEVGANFDEMGDQVERRLLDVIWSVREAVSIPVAVKISPFFSSLANFLKHVDSIHVDGLVLFNRFYQPDLDIENLDVRRVVNLSDSSELLLRLRWLALLYGRLKTPMAVTGGVHTAIDAVKSIMAGASACQMVSALLKR